MLAAGLRDLSPDVVAFQEVFASDGYDQVREVLGSGYHVFHQRGRDEHGGGASIASRWPLEVVREADVQFDKRLYKSGWIGSLAVVEVRVPEPIGPVLLAHHKPTWQSGAELEREQQAAASARIVEELLAGADRHVVLAGDFDATPDSASIRFLTGRQSLDGLSVYYQDALGGDPRRRAGTHLHARQPLALRPLETEAGAADRLRHGQVRRPRRNARHHEL